MKPMCSANVLRSAATMLSLFLALFAQDALGCSPVMGYVRPTNYELVKEADAIVFARAVSFEKKGELQRGKSFGIFKFKVLEIIKGDFKDESLLVEGDNDLRSWGEPDDFSYTKADHGPCNPTDYELGGSYVLFLSNWKRGWSVGGPPFTRVNVKVEGTNDPWTKAVRQYAHTAELKDYEKEKKSLQDLRSLALKNDPNCPIALAKDIDVHFKKPTPAKSFRDLKSLYEATDDSETRTLVLWACERGNKTEAQEFFRQLVNQGEWKKYLYPACSYINQVKQPGFHEQLAAALSDNHNENERRMLLFALMGTAGAVQQAFMQRVLESANKEEAAILSEWFVNYPSQEAIRHLTHLASKNYAEQTDLTFALAAMGDTNVVGWAKEFVKKPSERSWIGYYIFARSPLPEAELLARKVIQDGDSDGLVWLVEGYGDSKIKDRLSRLKEIVELKYKSQKLIFWLRRTLGDMSYHGDKQAELLLGKLPVVDSEK